MRAVSRLNSLDAAVHRLNVQFHHMDVKVSQFSQGLAEVKGSLNEARDSLASLNEIAVRNQKEIGRIDGEDEEEGCNWPLSCSNAGMSVYAGRQWVCV